MNFDFDVIDGLGSVNSTFNYYLSFNNIDCILIDEKKQIEYSLRYAVYSFISENMANTQNNFLASPVPVRIYDVYITNFRNSGKSIWYIANKYVVHAVHSNDFNRLNEYNNEFWDNFLENFSYLSKVDKYLRLLSENDLDYYVLELKEKNCEKCISRYWDMNTQSTSVKEFVKRDYSIKYFLYFFLTKYQSFLN